MKLRQRVLFVCLFMLCLRWFLYELSLILKLYTPIEEIQHKQVMERLESVERSCTDIGIHLQSK
jgi:hypothetical protein